MKELQVTYRGLGEPFAVGTLAEDRGEVLFQYSAEALRRGLDLSPLRLPLRVNAYPDRPNEYMDLHSVPGLVYDSLPDGWGFRLMHRRMRARGIDAASASTLDWLACLGDHTMGALTYAPALHDDHEAHDLSLLALAQEVQAVLTDDSHLVLSELARAGGSPGGARPKALVHFDPLTGNMSTRAGQVPGGQAWLVKFPGSDDTRDACAVEELYARMARRCELEMGPTQFFELPGEMTAFATRRFDRRGDSRVHVHTLAGLLHANFQQPSISYGEFFRATRRLTRDQRALKAALQRCVFNVLMNNRDDHAKNLSFLMEADGIWHLAPPYDLTYCPGYQGEHFMDVASEARAPARQHVLAAAQQGGLDAAVAAQTIEDMLARATPDVLLDLARDLPVSRKSRDTIHAAMKQHHARLASG